MDHYKTKEDATGRQKAVWDLLAFKESRNGGKGEGLFATSAGLPPNTYIPFGGKFFGAKEHEKMRKNPSSFK